jgi:hypothetical protein
LAVNTSGIIVIDPFSMILLPMMRWKANEEILDQREAIDTALARLALAVIEQNVSRILVSGTSDC